MRRIMSSANNVDRASQKQWIGLRDQGATYSTRSSRKEIRDKEGILVVYLVGFQPSYYTTVLGSKIRYVRDLLYRGKWGEKNRQNGLQKVDRILFILMII